MTTTRDGAATPPVPTEVGEASAFPGVRGLRWWAVLLLALVLTAGGVAADVLRSGTLGVIFLAGYPGGCVLASVLAQRRDIFVPMVQPPLLLAVSVPVAIAATGTLPTSGGMVSTALAIGAPLINGFPAMAVTTVVCVLIGLVRMRVQRWHPPDADVRRDPVRSGPSGGAGRDDRMRDDRARDERARAREERDRREAAERRAREERDRDERDRGDERDRRDAAERREQAEREQRRAQERARAERDREMAERDRAKRERQERELAERERARRERTPKTKSKKRPKVRPDEPVDDRGRTEGDRERLARAAEAPPGPTPRRSPLKGAGRDEAREQPPPPREPVAPARDARSREERMREERLREERRGSGRPPGVHPVRERPPERPPR